MTKLDAIKTIAREATADRGSNTAARRCVKAAKILGLDDAETVQLMGYLDYCGSDGRPYGKDIIRIW